jgi:hypothetical protein
MQLTRKQNEEREPMGIVIADGGQGDREPRLSAFVWGPVPDDVLLDDTAPLELAAAT